MIVVKGDARSISDDVDGVIEKLKHAHPLLRPCAILQLFYSLTLHLSALTLQNSPHSCFHPPHTNLPPVSDTYTILPSLSRQCGEILPDRSIPLLPRQPILHTPPRHATSHRLSHQPYRSSHPHRFTHPRPSSDLQHHRSVQDSLRD